MSPRSPASDAPTSIRVQRPRQFRAKLRQLVSVESRLRRGKVAQGTVLEELIDERLAVLASREAA